MPAYYKMEFLEFDEERDLNPYRPCWIIFGTFCIPALKPLELWDCVHSVTQDTIPRAGEWLSCPTHMGWDARIKDGYWYFSNLMIPEEEWKQREPAFRERMTPFIENFGKEWREKFVPELTAEYERLKKVEVEKLSNLELLEQYDEWTRVNFIQWLLHFRGMFTSLHLYGLFEDMCRELLGIDETHPQFKALLSGYDSELLVVDRWLWRLGERAVELGLKQTFDAIPDDEQLLSKLKESDAGRKWLDELNEFLQVYGWRVPPIIHLDEPSWIEKPSLALPDIRRAITRGGVFFLDQERKRLVAEREKTEKEVLPRIPAERRDMFMKLLEGARWSARWAEEHIIFHEFASYALGRRVTIEMGRRFAKAGVLDEPDDIYFLIPEEIRMSAVQMHRCSQKKAVRIRKEQWQEFLKYEPPPFIGDPSVLARETALNPVVRRIAPAPVVRPELKADLYATGSAAGVVEGIARVIMSEAEFSQLQPGEILVAPFTHADWTSLFWLAGGVVTDHGGSMAHAAIVGREYGLPVCGGCIDATRKIKTGDKIRVDGDNGCVYILK